MFEKARFYIAITVAFSCGWFGHGLFVNDNANQPNSVVINSPDNPPTPTHSFTENSPPPSDFTGFSAPKTGRESARENAVATTVTASQPSTPPVAEPNVSEDLLNQFSRYLNEREFEKADNLYQQKGQELPLKDQQNWQSILVNFLARTIANGETASFKELSELWLYHNYDDIDVILLLAKFNRSQGYYDEALQTYLQAKTYATNNAELTKVRSDLQDFIFTRENDWLKRGEWYALSNFFAKLDELDLANLQQKYRYAELLLMQQDEQAAFAVLDELVQLDPSWQQKVANLKRLYRRDGKYTISQTQSTGFESSIAMVPSNGHYLIDISLNNRQKFNLLLDTGATITMLTDDAFAEMVNDSGWKQLGWAMINTANGVVRGRVIEVEKLQFGGYTLENMRIVVQGTELGGGVQGLLGMNVLSKFHFQIDQDKHQLRLSLRQ